LELIRPGRIAGFTGNWLEPAKGPRDYLVIDHVEKPTEN
jgi:hypothetical protein